MSNYIDNYAESVRRLLEEGVSEVNDFSSLAIAGEQLRRASSVADASESVKLALKEYDGFLDSHKGEIPGELGDAIQETLAELCDYANAPSWSRKKSEGQELLLELDEVMMVAIAAMRTGACTRGDVASLGKAIQSSLSGISTKLSELGQFAEDREILFGSDADVPQAFGWWEEIAVLAPSRVALQATVSVASRKQRIMKAAIANFEAKHAPSAVVSFVAGLRDRLLGLGDGLRLQIPMATAKASSFSDDVSIPGAQHEIINEGPFSVFCDDKYLVCMVDKDHTIEPLRIEFSGKTQEAEVLGVSSFRVALIGSATVEITIRIDGETFTLPTVELENIA